jgi:predicted Fe-Mo cluster-binding NifX family protein
MIRSVVAVAAKRIPERSNIMKIAVTSQGKDLDAQVHPRFGRATYILIIDSIDESFKVLDNSDNVNAFKGAGIQAAAKVSDMGADVLLTGYCGPNAFRTLEAAGVKVANNISGTVREALEAIKQEKVSFAGSANTEGHW